MLVSELGKDLDVRCRWVKLRFFKVCKVVVNVVSLFGCVVGVWFRLMISCFVFLVKLGIVSVFFIKVMLILIFGRFMCR